MVHNPEVEGPATSEEDSPEARLARNAGGGETSCTFLPLKAELKLTGLFCREEDSSEAEGSELGLLMSDRLDSSMDGEGTSSLLMLSSSKVKWRMRLLGSSPSHVLLN